MGADKNGVSINTKRFILQQIYYEYFACSQVKTKVEQLTRQLFRYINMNKSSHGVLFKNGVLATFPILEEYMKILKMGMASSLNTVYIATFLISEECNKIGIFYNTK